MSITPSYGDKGEFSLLIFSVKVYAEIKISQIIGVFCFLIRVKFVFPVSKKKKKRKENVELF